MSDDTHRVVTCDLNFEVAEQARLVFQIAPAKSAGVVVSEELHLSSDGIEVIADDEVSAPHGGRVHVVRAPVGRLKATYRAEIDVDVSVLRGPGWQESDWSASSPSTEFAEILYLRPSRYCPTDRLAGFATAEFGTGGVAAERAALIVDWIRRRIEYLPGSGTVRDSAEDTLLTGMGTCRDFAHLGVALCRSVGIPARFSGVYAPGLSPMDFHAVLEVLHEGRWYVFDPTGLAPRAAMVRIATGRDAADAAFASVEEGNVQLLEMEVSAVVGSTLPLDDWSQLVELA
jgi:transglutaminase-like putative cysteine protease